MIIAVRNVSLSERDRKRRNEKSVWLPFAAILSIAAGLQTGEWIISVAILVLYAIWRFAPEWEGPPVIPMALTFQWVQVVSGVFYLALTGRHTIEIDRSDYRPMVLIGLGCVVALLLGLRLATKVSPPPLEAARTAVLRLGWKELAIVYAASVAVTGTVQDLAWRIAGLTQIVLAVSMFRLAVMFLLLRRLTYPQPRFVWLGIFLAGEVVMGSAGYFAGFREPLLLAIIAFLEMFDRKKASHWLALSTIGAVVVILGFLWLGIRSDYRKDFGQAEFASSRGARMERLIVLSSGWASRSLDERLRNLDFFVMRLWAVYYPALAMKRVPAVLPHEEGALLWGTIKHVLMPRLFFSDKDPLVSNSTLVRRYSGVRVAGEKENTSIAFGYAAESYVDFGVPVMFMPILVFGIFTGAALNFFLRTIRCREAGIVLVTVLSWSGLYLFEVSWSKMLGDMLTRMIFLGGTFILLDRAHSSKPRFDPSFLRDILTWNTSSSTADRRIVVSRSSNGTQKNLRTFLPSPTAGPRPN